MGKSASGIGTGTGMFLLAGVWGTCASIWPDFFKPHPYILFLLGLFGLVLIVVSSIDLIRTYLSRQKLTIQSQEPLNSIAKPIQDMQIELIEHGEFSSELLLECVNHGGPCTLIANMRVTGASPHLAFKRVGYKGTWVKPVSVALNRVGVEYNSKSSAYVATGGSANLRIATIDSPLKPEGDAYMHLSGTDQRAIWDLEHTATEDLPYFILDIEIRAEGKNGFVKRTYQVGPPHRNESLRMKEYRS